MKIQKNYITRYPYLTLAKARTMEEQNQAQKAMQVELDSVKGQMSALTEMIVKMQ